MVHDEAVSADGPENPTATGTVDSPTAEADSADPGPGAPPAATAHPDESADLPADRRLAEARHQHAEQAAERLAGVVIESPLQFNKRLSDATGAQVWLKREDLQPVFSFKLRGAYNKMANLTPGQLERGVICASAGNHAQGVALGARKLGCRAIIVMPTTTPQLKIDAVAALGGEVVLAGESYSDAYQHAVVLQEKQGLTFIHPFDDPDVIAGQGTVAMEMLQQLQKLGSPRLDAVFVAIGGGGLISGVANYIKAVRPDIKVIGVQTKDSDAMRQSVLAGQRVELADVGLFSDGTAVKLVGQETFRITQNLVDDFVVVDTDAVCAAIKDIFVDTRSIVEPAGALAVAAIKQYVAEHQTEGETYAAILCGANMNFDRLRFVAERAEIGEQREAVLAVTLPEKPGAYKKFLALIGNRNVEIRRMCRHNPVQNSGMIKYINPGTDGGENTAP